MAVVGGGDAPSGGNSSAPAPSAPASTKKADKKVEDAGNEPINLDDIPF